MSDLEYRRGEYCVSTSKSKLDLPLVHGFLCHASYWARGRPFAVVEESIQHSMCFGAYVDRTQIGFARVVTDQAVGG